MLILLVLLIFFAALGIPLAFAIGASCVTYILIYAPTFITMLPQRVWNGAYSELMIAMPLFMLAGELMNTGGITQRIINFCMELLRPIRGGLGEVNTQPLKARCCAISFRSVRPKSTSKSSTNMTCWKRWPRP